MDSLITALKKYIWPPGPVSKTTVLGILSLIEGAYISYRRVLSIQGGGEGVQMRVDGTSVPDSCCFVENERSRSKAVAKTKDPCEAVGCNWLLYRSAVRALLDGRKQWRER